MKSSVLPVLVLVTFLLVLAWTAAHAKGCRRHCDNNMTYCIQLCSVDESKSPVTTCRNRCDEQYNHCLAICKRYSSFSSSLSRPSSPMPYT
ncbi:hypothetical protein ACFX2A_013962 [Malus domestica]